MLSKLYDYFEIYLGNKVLNKYVFKRDYKESK